jgi:hypothetical protein
VWSRVTAEECGDDTIRVQEWGKVKPKDGIALPKAKS